MRLALAALLLSTLPLCAQEITLEEVQVEAVFENPLELSLGKSLQEMIARLQARAEAQRERDLRAAGQSPLTTLLDLTAHSPIPLGASEASRSAFFAESYLRPDLVVREAPSIFRP